MRRDALNELINWKNGNRRKPLVLQGARQVGKTWLMREFGRLEYNKTAYVSFDGNVALREAVSNYIDVKELITEIEISVQM